MDSPLEVEALLIEHYRSLEPWEKVTIVCALNQASDDAALAGIHERHPEADEREQRLRLAALKYGRDLVFAAYGWDAHVEGW